MRSEKDLFQEMETHLLQDERPSRYFNTLFEDPLFTKYPFEMLGRLKQTKQSPVHHPEGNVWNHTMLVIDEAARIKTESRDQKAFLWAALLHDIGKPGTSKIRKGKITSYDHDKLGAELAGKFLTEFIQDSNLVQSVISLVRWHMQILFVVHNLPFADGESMKRQTDLHEIALLGFCDRMGRIGADRQEEENNIQLFLQKCKVI